MCPFLCPYDAKRFEEFGIRKSIKVILISYRKLPQTDRELRRMCQLKNPLNHMTVMFSKKEVLDAGGYQHFYLFEDYWLWARMIKNGVKLINCIAGFCDDWLSVL